MFTKYTANKIHPGCPHYSSSLCYTDTRQCISLVC